MQTLNAEAVSEIRAFMARQGVTAVQISERSGESIFRIRRMLDRRTALTMDDFGMFCEALGVEPVTVLQSAKEAAAS